MILRPSGTSLDRGTGNHLWQSTVVSLIGVVPLLNAAKQSSPHAILGVDDRL